MHIATSEVEAFSISKKFLVRKIFPKYPTVYREIKEDSKHRYTATMKDPILKHKINHIEVVNKRSTYNEIQLKSKSATDITSFSHFVESKSAGETVLIAQQNFSEKIHVIEIEMKKFMGSLSEFMTQTTNDYRRVLQMVERMQESLVEVREHVRLS